MAEFVGIWSFSPQGTNPVELVEVAEKLRVREINLQNYIGRFLYQFWFKTSIDNLFCINENSPCTSSLLNFLVKHSFWSLEDAKFWRISQGILRLRSRYPFQFFDGC